MTDKLSKSQILGKFFLYGGLVGNMANKDLELFTEKEAAEILRISTVSLWRARKKRLITFRRILGRIIYTKNDLLEFIERSKRN